MSLDRELISKISQKDEKGRKIVDKLLGSFQQNALLQGELQMQDLIKSHINQISVTNPS